MPPFAFANLANPMSISCLGSQVTQWFDEHLTFKVAIQELSKSASRALGALTTKFLSVGGMEYKLSTKLFESLVQPILLYGAAVWGHTEHRKLNNIQTRALKLFLCVGKRASNLGSLGDMGWTSLVTKQRMEVFRQYIRLQNVDADRLLHKIHKWSIRRGNSWEARVKRLASKLNIRDIINSANSNRWKMCNIGRSLRIHDEAVWFTKLWTDKGINGNKLRTYRRFKKDMIPDSYVTSIIPRNYRRALLRLRLGCLPLSIATGRYTNIPLDDRLCKHCESGQVEDEINIFYVTVQFLMKLELIFLMKPFTAILPNFLLLTSCEKFVRLMEMPDIQFLLAKTVFLMLKYRRSLV
ncbi:uncharacterized protein LOC132547523 [Ylistrum balloti]|uniref:uncharacterized protein LOC132547523 n=1 Tax=Ylistrum balloti TaxID=509963 RepID=UPI002905AC42|nr:uncharacterized protein LOC132547523 [Ylistrum balloti]